MIPKVQFQRHSKLLEWKYFAHQDIWHRCHSEANAKLHNQKHYQGKITIIANGFSDLQKVWIDGCVFR